MNESRARAEAIARDQRRFLQALSAGQVAAIDRLGNRIEAGQKVLYHAPYDLIFDVQAISPVLDPNLPPGMIDVTVSVTFPIRMMANQVNPNAVIVSQRVATEATEVVPPSSQDTEDGPADPGTPLETSEPGGPRLVLTDPL